jgi:thioredoxin
MAKQVDIRPGTELKTNEDGTTTATFKPLDISGTGADEQAAVGQMIDGLNHALENPSEDVRKAFEAYAADNSVDVPEPGDAKSRAKEAMSIFPELDADSFDTHISSDGAPVLVDFWADWCMPCHMLAPTIRQLHDDFGGRLRVAKLNIDDHHPVADRFGIRSIPTLILFVDGNEKARISGAGRPVSEYAAELEPHL